MTPVTLPGRDEWTEYRREHLGITDAQSRGYKLQMWIKRVRELGVDKQRGRGIIDVEQKSLARRRNSKRVGL